MQIISGTRGGRKIAALALPGLRPAMGKTREALFSMLEARGIDWSACSVLDLFAGSGSLGLEALSRGAREAWFVDDAQGAINCIRRNAETLDLLDECRIFHKNAASFLRLQTPCPFNLVFIDPPYRLAAIDRILNLLLARGWLAPLAFLATETEKSATIEAPAPLSPIAGRMFGQTHLQIWINS